MARSHGKEGGVKAVLLFPLLLLFGCVDEKTRAEKARQQALEREVQARVEARTAASSLDSVSTLRVIVYGVTSVGGIVVLYVLGSSRPMIGDVVPTHPEDRSLRSGGRVLDLPHHENPPRR